MTEAKGGLQMDDKELPPEQRDWLNGNSQTLRLGGYGGTVTLEQVPGGIRFKATKPQRRERLISKGSAHETRAFSLRLALFTLEKVQETNVRKVFIPEAPEPVAERVTARVVWLAYLRYHLGDVPDSALAWTEKDFEKYLKGFTPNGRADAPTVGSLKVIGQAARRLHRDNVVPFDVDLSEIQVGDLNAWATRVIKSGESSAHTVKTYLRRLRTAVVTYKTNWKRQWGKRDDPTEGIRRIPTRHLMPAEIGEANLDRIIMLALKKGSWQLIGFVVIGRISGRRAGAIAASRTGLHHDAPPLTARDIKEQDGKLLITWRGNAAKRVGKGPGVRGAPSDDVTIASKDAEKVLRWLMTEHPNPLGPDYPLLWDEKDPRVAVTYSSLRREFNGLWEEATGTERPKGVLFHSICRTTITTLAHALGTLAAAEHTGRSEYIVNTIYQRRRLKQSELVAEALDETQAPISGMLPLRAAQPDEETQASP